MYFKAHMEIRKPITDFRICACAQDVEILLHFCCPCRLSGHN